MRRDECSPPPGKFDGEIWEQASASVEDYRRGLDERIGLGRAVREKEAADAAAGKKPETPKAPDKAWDDDDE